ncbi:MAG: 30S ribosomal protein S2 [Patescibacteria group bacterium]|nr:30S ribosomal protein S2 [Patescibacteria group bacterium]MCL5094192.1 30S ribosomal protein S2 [Patescibacteria group bacterium]
MTETGNSKQKTVNKEETKKTVKKVETKETKPAKKTAIKKPETKEKKAAKEVSAKEAVKEVKEKKVNLPEIDIKKLLESGAHFGHQTHRWNPKIAPYIFTKRNNIHIIDLLKTGEKLKEALEFIYKIAKDGGTILFVGTKKQAQQIIKEEAEKSASPYINEKWFGGMLTNFATVSERMRYFKDLEKKIEEDKYVTKKEKLLAEKELEKLKQSFGGILEMKKIPNAVYIVDVIKERNAVREAKKLGIPIVAIIDTNADPESVNYPIPANDDAIKSIQMLTEIVAKTIVNARGEKKEKKEEE